MKRVNWILILVFVLLLTGCIESQGSPTLLEDNSCAPSCWNGLILGNTSANDAFTILRQLPQVKQDSIGIQNPGKFHRAATFLLASGERVDLIFQNDILIYLGLYYSEDDALLNMTYKELIEEMGEPDSIIRADHFAGDCLYTLFLSLYDEKGIAYSFIENHSCLSLFAIKKVSPNTHIS